MAQSKSDQQLFEFLPAALEIQASPPPRGARAILWSLVVLLILAVIWAIVGEVDIVASAQGKIIPKQQVKVIQPIEDGIVRAIHISEGEKVEKGQLLLELEPVLNQADSLRLTQQLNSLRQDALRQQTLIARIQHSEVDTVLLDTLSRQSLLVLQSEYALYVNAQATLTADMARDQAELEAIKASLQRVNKILPLVQERADSLSSLEGQKMVPRDQYLAIKQEAIELEQQALIEQANIKRIQAEIESVKQNKAAQKADFVKTAYIELTGLNQQIQITEQELVKSRFLAQQAKLYAPVAGTIEKLIVTTIGGVVSSAQELLTIVPKDGELIVEAGLLNKDIGFAYPGQTVEVKIESFPFTRYGIIEGTVLDISTDAVEHEQLGLLFPIKVSLHSQTINVNGRIVPLSAGMSVMAEIKTGQRKIIDFLLSPIIQHIDEGARER